MKLLHIGLLEKFSPEFLFSIDEDFQEHPGGCLPDPPTLLIVHSDNKVLNTILTTYAKEISDGTLGLLAVSTDRRVYFEQREEEEAFRNGFHSLRWPLPNTPDSQQGWKLKCFDEFLRDARRRPLNPPNWELLRSPAAQENLLVCYLNLCLGEQLEEEWIRAAREEYDGQRHHLGDKAHELPQEFEPTKECIEQVLRSSGTIE